MKSMLRPSTAGRAGRRTAGRAQGDHVRDPYQVRRKLKEPAACPQCGAIYHHGRWQWGQKPNEAHEEACPACRRVADRMPAGIVTIRGGCAKERLAELNGLVRNEERAEKSEHPLNRIMG